MSFRHLLIAGLLAVLPVMGAATEHCTPEDPPRAALDLAEFSQAVDAHPYPRGIYWRISKGTAHSLLYGTVHVGDPRLSIPQSLFDAISNAERLILEVDDKEAVNARTLLGRLDVIFQIDGPDLKPQFTPQEWDAILAQLAKVNIPEVIANRMKPWALGASLFLDTCMLEGWGTNGPGVDDQLARFANAHDIPISGLEDADELLDLVANRNFEADIQGIKTLLAIMLDASLIKAANALDPDWTTDLYLQEETMAIWELMTREARKAIDHPIVDDLLAGFYDLLLVQRNQNWLDNLLPVLEEGNVVVAVGALHLPGKDGLLYLLEQRGYEVERIVE